MTLYLVDWGLPKNPSRYRVRFHRHLKQLMAKLNGDTIKYSSMSVVITQSKELARAIHNPAKSCEARRTSLYSINGGRRVPHKYAGTATEQAT